MDAHVVISSGEEDGSDTEVRVMEELGPGAPRSRVDREQNRNRDRDPATRHGFVKCSRFSGAVPNWEYKTGAHGLGYYKQASTGSGTDASRASTSTGVGPTDGDVFVVIDDSATDAGRIPVNSTLVVLDDDVEDEEVARARQEHFFGNICATIVGLQHYGGIVHNGEYVLLVREPYNIYDRNAIRVDNVHGVQVGHIKRIFAAALAPLMDERGDRAIRFEADVPGSTNNKYTLGCSIALYGLPEEQDRVKRHLQQFGLYLWKDERKLPSSMASSSREGGGRRGGEFGEGESQVPRSIYKKQSENELDKIFDNLQLSYKTSFELSPLQHSCMRSTLLPHQVKAVAWMLLRENKPDDGKLPSFWEKKREQGRTVYYNTITNSSQDILPENVAGGILADDMGLGKTLSILSLISISLVESEDRRAKPTLVICPFSVMQNWESQAEEHLHTNSVQLLVYHGPSRQQYLEDIDSYDIVVTTYATLVYEYDDEDDEKKKKQQKERPQRKKKRRGKCLFDINWHRVVLDEAHMIRNRSTISFKACSALRANHRWCLTGTPYVNKPADIQALFQFLKCSPLDKFHIWNRSIGRLVKNGNPLGFSRLRVLLGAICLYRRKDILENKLPEKTVQFHEIKLLTSQREVYDVLFKTARMAVTALMRIDGQEVLKHYSSILECLLRLRQACCSTSMIPPQRLAAAREVLEEFENQEETIDLEKAKELLERLKAQLVTDTVESAECCVCFETQTSEGFRILKNCSHCLCSRCLEKILQTERSTKAKCPLCRKLFAKEDIFSIGMLEENVTSNENESKQEEMKMESVPEECPADIPHLPAKLEAMLQTIESDVEQNPKEKFVIFSQFTSFLDVIQMQMGGGEFQSKIPMQLYRLDGKCNAKQRKESLHGFRYCTGPSALLISLKAGGTGLNLTCASKAFMMDLWWNPSVEEQAMDRIHRIGQTRPVRVIRYVCEDTVEKKILDLQEGKRIFGKGSMQKVSNEEMREARLKLLQGLFQ